MGTPFSWSKGQKGFSLQWIGARLTVRNGNSELDDDDGVTGMMLSVMANELITDQCGAGGAPGVGSAPDPGQDGPVPVVVRRG